LVDEGNIEESKNKKYERKKNKLMIGNKCLNHKNNKNKYEIKRKLHDKS
jgi:hypothetical protein